jgi:hypothetical protein
LRKIGKTERFCGEGRGERRKKTGFFEKISFRLFYFSVVSGMLKNRRFVFEFSPATFFDRRAALGRSLSDLGAGRRRFSPFAACFRHY